MHGFRSEPGEASLRARFLITMLVTAWPLPPLSNHCAAIVSPHCRAPSTPYGTVSCRGCSGNTTLSSTVKGVMLVY